MNETVVPESEPEPWFIPNDLAMRLLGVRASRYWGLAKRADHGRWKGARVASLLSVHQGPQGKVAGRSPLSATRSLSWRV